MRPTSDEMQETRKKAFFERFTYNTLAIEGNKLSTEDIRAIVENDQNRAFRVREGLNSHHLQVHGILDVLKHIRSKKYTIKYLCDKCDLEVKFLKSN